MMIQYGLWGFMLLLIAGCNRIGDTFSETNEIEIIHINPNEVTEVKVSDMFSEIRYLKLESPEGVHLSDVTQLEVLDDRIFLLDDYGSRNVLVFNMQGQFIHEFKPTGIGPGEFINPRSFALDEKSNRIIIYCNASMRLISYDLSTYTYVTEKK